VAYLTPKENWAANDIPVASDFNRIEGNAKENYDAIVAEVSARIAEEAARIADVNAEEAARIADVNAEEAARIAGDNALAATTATKAPLPTTSSDYALLDYPIGTTLLVLHPPASPIGVINSIIPVWVNTITIGVSFYSENPGSGAQLVGTWRSRGYIDGDATGTTIAYLCQRVS